MYNCRRLFNKLNLGIVPIIGTVLGLLFCTNALAATKPARPPGQQIDRLASDVIDFVEVEPYDKWLVLSVHFNHNIQYGWFLPRKPSKTFIIRLYSVPSVKKHNTLPHRGEYHAVPKEYRDVIESVTYDGSTEGGPYLIVQLYQQSEIELKPGPGSQTIQVRISPAESTPTTKEPEDKPDEKKKPTK
jgi:hypothetical protein